ncbi:23S rRNA (Uracil-5-) -methyltransferase RumA [Candidatus Rhodobacter oscarellae]|uniref:23S rRNA (Uracil-5-)-methyltransferase RumA n=1 Tax=Candidatus Rhodobacter oscarellae TaxID=1675527 RepID=A0A0J9E815_9RHOB|nr:RsmD family RNA methyltransferase [Candidatus Rhodobacter lobularis]KMW58876.1 23S rRNA (Uracil-5-) -methyltransferase RumA [Candidatus Rhodobacter lobularis]
MPEYTIERLGHHGDGIAPGPVFAPLTLPGEVVTGDLDKDRIAAPKIVTPSPDRVSPPCTHFKRCGGCALQHARDPFVESWKRQVLTEALAAHGLPAPIRAVHSSPRQTRRRATFSGRRTKSGALVGFHGRGSDVIHEVPGCQTLLPEITAMIPALDELVRFGASRKGELSLSVTWSEAGADVSIRDAKDLTPPQIPEATALAQRHSLARLTWNGETLLERHAPVQVFDGIAVTPPPDSFLQATAEGQDALIQAVLETVSGAKRIVDLFAGCGTFALPLSRHADVLAVEGEAEMLYVLDRAWRAAPNLHQVTTEKRDLFRRPLVPQDLNRFDAAVIDPPRAGAAAQIAEIAQSDLATLAMVSCNPVTFARDAKTLTAAGFAINWIDLVDQFRWSPHIELAASFSR